MVWKRIEAVLSRGRNARTPTITQVNGKTKRLYNYKLNIWRRISAKAEEGEAVTTRRSCKEQRDGIEIATPKVSISSNRLENGFHINHS